MKFTPLFVQNLINYTFKFQRINPQKKSNIPITRQSLYIRQLALVWRPQSSHPFRVTPLPSSKVKSYQFVNVRYRSLESTSLQPSTGRTSLINNHINRLVVKSKNLPFAQLLRTNTIYLNFLLNFTWATQLLTKNLWYTIVTNLPQNSGHYLRQTRPSSPQATFWNQLLLTKI